jgi:hypothetical protein
MAALAAVLITTAATPRHVLTSDYWMGYAGTKNVPAGLAARSLSWVSTDAPGSAMIAPLGVKTMLYTNPNRVQPGDPLYSDNDDQYAHTCSGSRARGEASYKNLFLTEPSSPNLAQRWKRSVNAHAEGGHIDAVFVDSAVGAVYAQDQPCGYTLDNWLRSENQLFRSLNYPVIYNGLNHFDGHNVAKEIALNQTAAGGMMEECYAQLSGDHRVGGWRWIATEQTEIRMARDRKLFFCYGRDLTPADQAFDSRMYAYASFLLTYDPNTSVLWEYYKTPTGGHVMPESRLVAWNPVKTNVTSIEQLRAPEGVYMRAYRDCYLDGRRVGPCAAAVNPDDDAHAISLKGYRRVLALSGSGIFDGGTAQIAGGVPSSLASRQAIVAFK